MSTDSPGPAFPILKTKLHRPSVAPDVVRREPVLARLDAGRHLPLTLVSAPAGYGKSSLISEWLESRDEAWAWLSIDEADGDLRQFLEYLLAGVHSRFPEACADTLALLGAPDLPPVPVIARWLGNELNALEAPVVFALDDYHHIDPTSAVHKLLGRLLQHPPRPLHLVILTRRDPPLPVSGLRARGMMTEVRQSDLRLTRAECGAFLGQSAGLSVSEGALARLEQMVEGWAAGLRLVSLALRRQEDPERFLSGLEGGIPAMQDYLVAEVLARLPSGQ